jgi:hypothetical protein
MHQCADGKRPETCEVSDGVPLLGLFGEKQRGRQSKRAMENLGGLAWILGRCVV